MSARRDGVKTFYVDGLYEITVIPDRGESHTKYVVGINNEIVAQMTRPNATLLTITNPGVLKHYYDNETLAGLAAYAYGYMGHMAWNAKTLKAGMLMLTAAALIACLIIFVMTFQRKKYIFVPSWAVRTSPLVMLAIFVVFGFSACDIGGGNTATGNAPWNEYQEEEETIIDQIADLFDDDSAYVNKQGMPEAGVVFFHPDYTGNVSYTTDLFGNVRNRLAYKPYGEVYKQTGTDNFRYKYNEKERDNVTGFVYYGARWYDPEIGRFTKPDTEVPDPNSSQSYNRYLYVDGSPVALQDEQGNKSVWGKICNAVETITSHIGERIYSVTLQPIADIPRDVKGIANGDWSTKKPWLHLGNITLGMLYTYSVGPVMAMNSEILEGLAFLLADKDTRKDMRSTDKEKGSEHKKSLLKTPKGIKLLHDIALFCYSMSYTGLVLSICTGNYWFIPPCLAVILVGYILTEGKSSWKCDEMRMGQYHFQYNEKGKEDYLHKDKYDVFVNPFDHWLYE